MSEEWVMVIYDADLSGNKRLVDNAGEVHVTTVDLYDVAHARRFTTIGELLGYHQDHEPLRKRAIEPWRIE